MQRWLGWYRAGGLAPIEGRHAGSQGAPSFLTPEEQTQLLDAKADIVVVLGADAHVPEVASSGSNQGPSSDTSDTSSTDDR